MLYGADTTKNEVLIADPAWKLFKKSSTQSEADLIHLMVLRLWSMAADCQRCTAQHKW